MKLNKNCVYDLSELTSEELEEVANYMQNNHGWKGQVPHTDLFWHDVSGTWLYNKHDKVNDMVNAKELFYTLENVQVDCSELSEEQIKEMCDVFEANRHKQWMDEDALKLTDDYNYLRTDWENEFFINRKDCDKTTITYEKFMELFAEPQYEVKIIVEAPKPKHYSKGIDTFARMEANCTKEECLAFAKGNIDKYNWRNKGQDLEDYKKIVSYANWAIKLLKDEK